MTDYDKVIEAASEYLFWTSKVCPRETAKRFANAQEEYTRCRSILRQAILDYHSCSECPIRGTNSYDSDCNNYPLITSPVQPAPSEEEIEVAFEKVEALDFDNEWGIEHITREAAIVLRDEVLRLRAQLAEQTTREKMLREALEQAKMHINSDEWPTVLEQIDDALDGKEINT